MIIYMCRIVTGLVPNPELEWTYNDRTNIKVKPSYCHSAPAALGQNNMGQKFLLKRTQTLQHSNIKHQGTRRHKNSNQKTRRPVESEIRQISLKNSRETCMTHLQVIAIPPTSNSLLSPKQSKQ